MVYFLCLQNKIIIRAVIALLEVSSLSTRELIRREHIDFINLVTYITYIYAVIFCVTLLFTTDTNFGDIIHLICFSFLRNSKNITLRKVRLQSVNLPHDNFQL